MGFEEAPVAARGTGGCLSVIPGAPGEKRNHLCGNLAQLCCLWSPAVVWFGEGIKSLPCSHCCSWIPVISHGTRTACKLTSWQKYLSFLLRGWGNDRNLSYSSCACCLPALCSASRSQAEIWNELPLLTSSSSLHPPPPNQNLHLAAVKSPVIICASSRSEQMVLPTVEFSTRW